jgi:nitric oxide reductase NorE protein
MTDTKKLEIDKFEPTGGYLIWIVIFIEFITFAIALIFFKLNALETPEIFHNSGMQLNKTIGFLNTIILLTSGFFMAEAIRFLKLQHIKKYKKYVFMTVVLGLTFIVLKSFEYYTKFSHQISFETNLFYTYYFMLTGFHLIHILFGIVLLTYFYFTTKQQKLEDIEATASFWHMCDLIWLLIFPIIYLTT